MCKARGFMRNGFIGDFLAARGPAILRAAVVGHYRRRAKLASSKGALVIGGRWAIGRANRAPGVKRIVSILYFILRELSAAIYLDEIKEVYDVKHVWNLDEKGRCLTWLRQYAGLFDIFGLHRGRCRSCRCNDAVR